MLFGVQIRIYNINCFNKFQIEMNTVNIITNNYKKIYELQCLCKVLAWNSLITVEINYYNNVYKIILKVVILINF